MAPERGPRPRYVAWEPGPRCVAWEQGPGPRCVALELAWVGFDRPQAQGPLPAQVLPPLRDVRTRPEVGEQLRNKLVRLMTHLDTDVKRVAAEFLFVLCSESGELGRPGLALHGSVQR